MEVKIPSRNGKILNTQMKLLLGYFVIAISILMLSSCMGSYTPPEAEEPPETPGGLIQASDLFKEGTPDSDRNVTTHLYTNDPAYWSMNGYTFWTVWGDEGINDPYTERTVTMSKVKGNSQAGYGLVICEGVREVNGEEVDTMLVFMINDEGSYAVGKVLDGKYESQVWWTRNAAIRPGLGAPNEITIRKNGEAFEVIVNGQVISEYVEGDEPRHMGGRNGYVAVISPLDKFPQNEVDIYYTEKR